MRLLGAQGRDGRHQASRIAVRLSAGQDALIRPAAEVEDASVTDFTVAASLAHAKDALADRRVFAIDRAAWEEFSRYWIDPSPTSAAGEAVRRSFGPCSGLSGYRRWDPGWGQTADIGPGAAGEDGHRHAGRVRTGGKDGR